MIWEASVRLASLELLAAISNNIGIMDVPRNDLPGGCSYGKKAEARKDHGDTVAPEGHAFLGTVLKEFRSMAVE
jgi:hypothetical protein